MRVAGPARGRTRSRKRRRAILPFLQPRNLILLPTARFTTSEPSKELGSDFCLARQSVELIHRIHQKYLVACAPGGALTPETIAVTGREPWRKFRKIYLLAGNLAFIHSIFKTLKSDDIKTVRAHAGPKKEDWSD
jgi:hypothetical protein